MIGLEQIAESVILGVISAIPTAIIVYLGFIKGTGKTVDVAIDKLGKHMSTSATAQRALKIIEMSDKLFGDDQAVEQITEFFKEARVLVTSPEAKALLTSVTALIKDLSSSKPEKIEIELPKYAVLKKELQPDLIIHRAKEGALSNEGGTTD